MLMTFVGDHGVQRVVTGSSKGGEQPQSLGQHVTDMGKPAKGKRNKALHLCSSQPQPYMIYPANSAEVEERESETGSS